MFVSRPVSLRLTIYYTATVQAVEIRSKRRRCTNVQKKNYVSTVMGKNPKIPEIIHQSAGEISSTFSTDRFLRLKKVLRAVATEAQFHNV